jgi:hypothetical protein
MRKTCPKCKSGLTIKDAIRNSCSKCTSLEKPPVRNGVGGASTNSSDIRSNFDALISEELKKGTFRPAA